MDASWNGDMPPPQSEEVWFNGKVEIEIGGQQLVIEFKFQPVLERSPSYPHSPADIEFTKASLKVGIISTLPAKRSVVNVHLIDITDLLTEVAVGDGTFWDQVQELFADQLLEYKESDINLVD